jgi:hypothetical protein
MDNYVPPLNVTFGAILCVSALVTLVWIIGDALDGGSQSLLPPVQTIGNSGVAEDPLEIPR